MAAPLNDPAVAAALLEAFAVPVFRDRDFAPGEAYSFTLGCWVQDPLECEPDAPVPPLSPEEVAFFGINEGTNLGPGPGCLFPPAPQVPALFNFFSGPVAHNNNVAQGPFPAPPLSQSAIPQPAPRPNLPVGHAPDTPPGTISPTPARQGKKLNFPCTVCDEKFIDNRRRARHLAAQHGVGEADTKECSVEGCGHKGRSDNVRRHETLKHGMHKHA